MSEELWPLPSSWAWAAFGDVAQVSSDLRDPTRTPDAFHLAPNYVESGSGRLIGLGTVASDGVRSPKHAFRPGQIVYSKIRPYLAKAVLVEFEGLCSADMYPITSRAQVMEPRYLLRWLVSPAFTSKASESQGRTVLPKINHEALNSKPVPVAPLPEQKRIADKLDALLARVDVCRGRLDRVSAILKRFREAVLAAATSGELTREWREEQGKDGETQSFHLEDAEVIRDYRFPASWSIRRLAEVASITGGVTKDSKKQSSEFMELPYLRVANVQRGYLDLSEVKTIRVPPDRVGDLLLRAGDILFNEGGDIDKLGRGWIWNDELPECVFQNHVFRARLFDSAFQPRYFSWYGNSRGHEYFLARGKQTTNLASINKSVLSSLPVAVPPADEQAEIVRRADELFKFADRLERHCARAAARAVELTPSALTKAFRGELVPQDPNDEPASALLARVRAHSDSAAKINKPKSSGMRGGHAKPGSDSSRPLQRTTS